jgi:sec-independent protein translocase protein TatA
MMRTEVFGMGPVGVQEMIVIFLVALVLFGPKKLPELGKTIGKALTEFRRAQSELKSTFETHMRELEKENEAIKEVTRPITDEIYNHYTGYDSSYYDSGAVETAANALNPSPASAENPTPAGAAVPPSGEPALSQEVPAHGTVPRTANSEPAPAAAPVHAAVDAAPAPTHPAADAAAAPDSHSTPS